MSQYIKCKHRPQAILTFAPNGVVSHQRCTRCNAIRYRKGDGSYWKWTGARKVRRIYKKRISVPQALEMVAGLLNGMKEVQLKEDESTLELFV